MAKRDKLGLTDRKIAVLDKRISQLTMSLDILKKERSTLQKQAIEMRIRQIGKSE